jgi:vitamin B12 transporter
MKIFSLVFLIVLLSAAGFAQSGAVVSGQVTGADGKAIANAAVSLTLKSDPKISFATQASADGKYHFDDVPAGTYVVTATGQGGLAQANDTVKVVAGRTVTLDLTVLPVVNAQVTIDSGTMRPIDEVSKTTNIIEAREMRERADFTLVDTLATLPGFRMQRLGGGGRLASIKTRGLRNQDTAVLIDGIRFRDAGAITGDASGFLSDFTLTSVSKIEVLRGSGSSLYGTNAIGGTIDFQTPKPQPGMRGAFSGVVGGLGLTRFRGNFSDGTYNGKIGYNLGVSRTSYTKGIDGDDDSFNTNFQSRLEYNPFKRTNISARFFLSDAYVRLNTSPDAIGTLPASTATIVNAVPLSLAELRRYASGTPAGSLNVGNANFIPDTDDPDNFQTSKFFFGQFVVTQVLTDDLVLRGSYQGLKTGRKNENGPLGVEPFPFTVTTINDGGIHTANANLNWASNSFNEVTGGYEYEREKFFSRGYSADILDTYQTSVVQTSHTFYAQDVLSLFKRHLQLAGGARAQFFDLNPPVFSGTNPPYQGLTLGSPPNAYTFDGAASYFFDKSGTKVRIHVGNGYRVASLYERFGTFFSSFTQTFVAQGDPNLKPERSLAFDGGIDQRLFKSKILLSGGYFYTHLRDIIRSRNLVPPIGTTPRPFGGFINAKGGISRGAEFSGTFKPTRSTDIFTSYTFTNSDQAEPQIDFTNVYETLVVPKHQFSLVATQRFHRFWVNFDFIASSDYLGPIFESGFPFRSFVYRFKGIRKGDVTAGYELPGFKEKMHFTIFGTIENVFDQDYYESGFRNAGINGRGGVRVSF